MRPCARGTAPPGSAQMKGTRMRPWYANVPLSIRLMIAHQVAMVAGEYDHGIVGQTKLVEPLEYLGNAVVDHGDHAVGERDRLARFALGHCEGGLGVSDARAGVARGMQRCDMRRLRPVADPERVRQRHVRGLVHVPIAAGRRERMVRIGKRALEEERSAIAALRVLSSQASVRSTT